MQVTIGTPVARRVGVVTVEAPRFGPEGEIYWEEDPGTAVGLPDALDQPADIDLRLPTPARFVPANVRHYYRYDLEQQMFHRIDGLDDTTVLASCLNDQAEEDTRDPHFYTKTTVLTDGRRLTPAAM